MEVYESASWLGCVAGALTWVCQPDLAPLC